MREPLPKSHEELPLGSPESWHQAEGEPLHPFPSDQTPTAVRFSVLHELKFLAGKATAHPIKLYIYPHIYVLWNRRRWMFSATDTDAAASWGGFKVYPFI